jgi:L-alanine-DL-glutamate epimerase-like enolase superfamily enzyme
VKIMAVRAAWLRAPIPAERRHTSDFGVNDSFNTCLVEIDTDAGLTGLGEAKVGVGNLGHYAALVTLIHAELAPLLIGRDPRDVTALWETVYNGTRAHYVAGHGRTFPIVGRRGITVSALSGIDIALWDLLGRALGQPVWRLLGGRLRERIPAYASAARVREARQALGPDVGLMVDAHGTWSVREAQRFARKVADCDLAWLEEPVSPDNPAGQAEVRASTDIPIAAGETEQTRFAFRDLIDARAVDVLQPDVAIAGGITETLRICALAATHGLTVAPHLWGGAVLFASGLHLAVATPCVTTLEFSRGENPLLHELVREPFDLVDGHVLAPDRPGLGLTLDRDFVRSITVPV